MLWLIFIVNLLIQLWLSIEIKTIAKNRAIVACIALSVISHQPATANVYVKTSDDVTKVAQSQWSRDELYAIAKTLAGECYDDKELDKRRVCEVILNRVSNSKFANTILEVLTTPGAFNGYWRQSRPITENDYAVAEQALRDWYDGGCEPLSEWLFFSVGSKRENVFRSKYRN